MVTVIQHIILDEKLFIILLKTKNFSLPKLKIYVTAIIKRFKNHGIIFIIHTCIYISNLG